MRQSIVLDQGKQAWPFLLYQYASFFLALQYRDNDHNIIPLTGYTAELEIRRTVDSDEPALLTLTSNPVSGLDIDAANGLVMITITDDQTAALPEMAGQNQGRWDVMLTAPGGFVTRLLGGPVTVLGSVTRP